MGRRVQVRKESDGLEHAALIEPQAVLLIVFLDVLDVAVAEET